MPKMIRINSDPDPDLERHFERRKFLFSQLTFKNESKFLIIYVSKYVVTFSINKYLTISYGMIGLQYLVNF